MKIIYYGEGDPAWFEPESEEEKQLLALAAKEKWTFAQVLEKSKENGR